MARLAAYYQEDFHYVPVGHGSKQRKASYVIYDEPKNNIFNNSYINGGPRLRALASSDPSLTPTYTYSPKTAIMTLNGKPHSLNNKLVDQSKMAVQRLENLYETPEVVNPYAVARLESEMFECESVYSQGGRNEYEDTYAKHKHKAKDKIRKRLSYNDSIDGRLIPDMCMVRTEDCYHVPNHLQIQTYDDLHGDSFPIECNYIDQHEQCFTPPVSFRSDSSHGRWQQWPWNMVDTRASPAMLSPPSPLDSGLSSQSITSNPSLEAEPVRNGQVQAIRPDIHHMCSCSPRMYAESGRVISPPSRYDSGRSSPGAYSITSRSKKSLSRIKNGKKSNNGVVYVENDFENPYSCGQVRYGMLGLIGEPVQEIPVLPKVPNGHYQAPEYIQSSNIPATYYYVEENGGPVKVSGHRSSKSQPKYTRPRVVITEASDKSASVESASSPEQESFDRSPEPQISVSTPTPNSTSNTSSVSSADNEPENGERRKKSSKKTEKDIRELEDMYKKCNLGDYDLLERAERRDLPTAHQTKKEKTVPGLTRSKSDTLYEMIGSTYSNPYEVPQRAPPLRRSGIPDLVADDMALRKLSKPITAPTFNPVDNTVTYMLCSSHFTPTVPANKDILYMDNPDVEYDDLSYRKHYYGKKSKILDPQPPFGIPLRPPPPQSVYNDYLHVVPMSGLKNICHPRRDPDVVRDDLAFRALRKDEAESLYYDAADVYKKKKRLTDRS